MHHIIAIRRTLRVVAAAIIVTSASLAVACADGGKHDSGEQAGDPSTQPNGVVKPDSNTQNAISPAPGATSTGTATSTSTSSATGTSAPR